MFKSWNWYQNTNGHTNLSSLMSVNCTMFLMLRTKPVNNLILNSTWPRLPTSSNEKKRP